MESELFGHKRGSFTGAVADKKGLVQSAEGGTLFLDEVADLPLHMQVKLLRVIQEKTVRPIGESQRAADRRAHPVGHAQEPRCSWSPQGRFREDLYYRINVIEIRVPALRERAARHPGAGRDASCGAWRGASAAMPRSSAPRRSRRCETYAFPGNVRELENILERALTLCVGRHHRRGGHLQLRTAARRRRAAGRGRPPAQLAAGAT